MLNSDSMPLTDTHIHLYAGEFDADRHALISEAVSAGINRFILPNIDRSSIQPLYAVCEAYPELTYPMMGLHPCSVHDNSLEELSVIEKEFGKRKFFAVGEIGLDFYWDKTYLREQETVFIRQLHRAHELKLPVVIHSRNSIDRIIEIIRQHRHLNTRGVFHCFTGNARQAEQILELGMYLGIGGVITFRNNGLDKVLEKIPPESLLLETDAPYLAPAPHRGKRNVPGYLSLIAEKTANLKNIPSEKLAAITSLNAEQLFALT